MLMMTEIYEAFREAKVKDTTAKRAATSLGSMKVDLVLLKWMVGTNLAVSLATLYKLIA